jgi:8-oxo-dGTP pyrophosphatase MutT (NUDIX family)
MERELCAGILFISSKGTGLFLKRADDYGPQQYRGLWGLPGGHLRPSETSEQAARREAREEIGQCPKGRLWEVARQITVKEGNDHESSSEIDYTTFLMEIEHEFIPELNKEHSEFIWAPLGNAPEPIHPGLRVTLNKMNMDELGIAELIRDGKLTSPQKYNNIHLFDIRITGTGASYRSGLDEYVWRDSSLYLNDRFLKRCNGLPVIFEHPNSSTLNTKEYVERNIGSVFIPYIKGDEVWAIVKIWDEHAARIMENNRLSTSPAVVLGNDDKYKDLKDGNVLLIEDVPRLLDHIAICQVGVWDKQGPPAGVSSITVEDLVMADNDEKAAALEAARKADEAKAKADKAKKDADESEFAASGGGGGSGETLDKTLKCLDAMGARMDAWEESEKEKEKAKADKKARKDAKRAAAADAAAKADAQAKKDAEEAETKAKEDQAKADAKAKADAESDVRKRISDVEARLPKQMTDADFAAISDAQVKYDRVNLMHGKRASRPMDGETLLAYRRRLASDLKEHSPSWKGIDLRTIADETAFGNIESIILADAENAALHPAAPPEDYLREIVNEDITGRKISTFVGKPSAWMKDFTAPKRRLVGIRNSN